MSDNTLQNELNSALKIPSVREAVLQNLERYFADCGNVPPTQLYALVLEQVEAPLLQALMEKYRYNQSKVSIILGLSRGTTRKLLKKYGMID